MEKPWASFRGLWGTFTDTTGFDGPQGPKFIDVTTQNRFNEPIEWAGLNNYYKVVINTVTNTVEDTTQKIKLIFGETLETGTEVAIELHKEFINFGTNVQDLNPLPYFWDITSSLGNGTFSATVILSYDDDSVVAVNGVEENIVGIYYNPETDRWEPQVSVVDTEANTVSFDADHFSRYAIGFAESEVEEKPTLDELYEELREIISSSELTKNKKRWLLLQVNVSERLSNKPNKKFNKASVVLLKNIDRKVSQYEDKGMLTEEEKEKIEMSINKIINF